ncbi:MAG TPA: hypothetical protein VNZ58_03635 [Thermomicrobiales bacterium]|nr:hypothetical protein [Thermomicrobiales bacterium]
MTHDEREPIPIMGEWRKTKVYRCRLCAFDSTDRAKFEDHFAKAHPPLQILDGGLIDESAPDEPDEETSAKNGATRKPKGGK